MIIIHYYLETFIVQKLFISLYYVNPWHNLRINLHSPVGFLFYMLIHTKSTVKIKKITEKQRKATYNLNQSILKQNLIYIIFCFQIFTNKTLISKRAMISFCQLLSFFLYIYSSLPQKVSSKKKKTKTMKGKFIMSIENVLFFVSYVWNIWKFFWSHEIFCLYTCQHEIQNKPLEINNNNEF